MLRVALAAIAWAVFIAPSYAQAAALLPSDEGDLLIAEQSTGRIMLKDLARPASEEPAVFSGGGLLNWPQDTVVAPNGDVFVTSEKGGAIVKIEAFTGKQTVVSQGGHLIAPVGIDLDGQGNLVVADYHGAARGGAVIKIDPRTGAQTLLASGGQYRDPIGIAFDFAGGSTLWIADANTGSGERGTLWQYDIAGRTSTARDANPSFDPWAVAVAPNGDTWTADVVGFGERGAIQARDRSGAFRRSIPLGNLDPAGIDVGYDGAVYVSDHLRFTGSGFERGASVGVFSVNAVTGATALVSPANQPKGITVVPPLPTYTWDNCCRYGPDTPNSKLDMQQVGTGTYFAEGKRLVYHQVWFFGRVSAQLLDGVCLGGLETKASLAGPEYALCGTADGFTLSPNNPSLGGGGPAEFTYLHPPQQFVGWCCDQPNPLELTSLFVAYDPAKIGRPAELSWQASTRYIDRTRCKAGGGGHDVTGGCVDLLPDKGNVVMRLPRATAASATERMGTAAQVTTPPPGLRLLPPTTPPADRKGPRMRLRRSTVAVSSGGKGRLRLGCRRAEPAGCRSVTATLRGLRATASRPLIQAGKTVTLRFTVGRRLRRLRREGTLRARLVLGAYDQLANRGRVRKRVTLTLRD